MKKFLMAALLLIFFVPRGVSAEEIIIFHTNDMHCRILNSDEKGKAVGLAEMVAAVKTTKAKSKNVFWFDAGDTFQGLPRVNISKGENMLPLLNAAGIDLMVPGNHEFDYGLNQLEKLSKKLKFPTIAANISLKSNRELVFPPYKILKCGNIKIGVFGLATPETINSAAPENIADVNFLDPVETAKKMIKILRPQCDILIAVTHLGIEEISNFKSESVAAETEGIDLIIDGHSHTELPEGLTVKNTLIVQTGCFTHNLGRVTIDFSDGKIISKKAELLNPAAVKNMATAPDKKLMQRVQKLEDRNQKFFSQVLAHSDKKLSAARPWIRTEEKEIGNLCADAFRWKGGTDIALVNCGSIRADLPAGDVTRGDILAIMQFGNQIKTAEVDGKTIRAILEISVSVFPNEYGSFMQVSGMNFTFDPSQPVGQRVQDIFIGDEPLDENKIYTLTTSDFIFSGGGDYTFMKNAKIIKVCGIDNEILTEYINKFGVNKISLGRILNLQDIEEKKAA